jgi:hypothetical protein
MLLGTNRRPSAQARPHFQRSSGGREGNSDMPPTPVFGSRIQIPKSAERDALCPHRWKRATPLSALKAMVDSFILCVPVLISYEAYAALAKCWGCYRPIQDHPITALILSCVLVAMLARSGAYRSNAGRLRIREPARAQGESFFREILKTANSPEDGLFYVVSRHLLRSRINRTLR